MTEEPDDRDRILGTARVLIPRQGLSGYSEGDLEEAAGVPAGSVHRLFSSKGALFGSLVRRELEALDRRLWAAMAADDDPAARLRTLVRTRLVHLHELSELFEHPRATVSELFRQAESLKRPYLQNEYSLIHAILLDGNKSGRLWVEDTKLAAGGVALRLKQLELPVLLGQYESLSRSEVIDSFIGIILTGIDVSTEEPQD